MKLRTMYDSTNPGDIPARAKMVAGYVDGGYVTAGKLSTARPHAQLVTISVNGSKPADVIDRESGDVGARKAVQLVDDAKAHTVYCNLASLRDVLEELQRRHLEETPIWTAHWTGRRHLCGPRCLKPYRLPFAPNVVATQYADPKTSGGHYDVSAVRPHWPGVDTPAKSTSFTRRQVAVLRRARRVLRRRAASGVPLAVPDRALLTELVRDVDAARGLRRP